MADSPKRQADDDRVKLPLDAEEALRALLAVDPESDPADEGGDEADEADEPRSDEG